VVWKSRDTSCDGFLFPKEQAEGWWLVVGSEDGSTLLGIKRVAFGVAKAVEKLEFMPPTTPGKHVLKLFLMSDSFIGADQEFEVQVSLAKGEEMDDEDDEDDNEMEVSE
jgi:pre-mRNA-splicing helicase BRR2